MTKKTKKISIRLPMRLYKMINELAPLFEFNESAVIVDILKKYEYSVDHQGQVLKLERGRFVALFREHQMRERLHNLEKRKEV